MSDVVGRAVEAITGIGGVLDRVLCEVGIPVCDGFERQQITGQFINDLLRDLLDERGKLVERIAELEQRNDQLSTGYHDKGESVEELEKQVVLLNSELAAARKRPETHEARREALQAAHDAVPEHVTGTPIAQAEIKRLMKANEQGGGDE